MRITRGSVVVSSTRRGPLVEFRHLDLARFGHFEAGKRVLLLGVSDFPTWCEDCNIPKRIGLPGLPILLSRLGVHLLGLEGEGVEGVGRGGGSAAEEILLLLLLHAHGHLPHTHGCLAHPHGCLAHPHGCLPHTHGCLPHTHGCLAHPHSHGHLAECRLLKPSHGRLCHAKTARSSCAKWIRGCWSRLRRGSECVLELFEEVI